MKIIKIERCIDCRHLDYSDNFCEKEKKNINTGPFDSIPDWCSLEDYDETLKDRRPLFSEEG